MGSANLQFQAAVSSSRHSEGYCASVVFQSKGECNGNTDGLARKFQLFGLGVANVMGSFFSAYPATALSSFEAAVAKLRACGERKSAFFRVLLNQKGLACVQLFKIDEVAELFEEARAILEQECSPCHQDTLGVYSNLAATYDALGRIEDAIEILEYVLKLREEKLGTANADFDDEKKRLTELLKEAGRSRNRKAKSLENLIDPNSKRTKKEPTKKRSGFGFRL